MAKANKKARAAQNFTANAGYVGAAIGATIGLTISMILVLSLLPTVQDARAEAEANPNSTSAETGIVGLYPLVFVSLPLIGAVAGGAGGYLATKK